MRAMVPASVRDFAVLRAGAWGNVRAIAPAACTNYLYGFLKESFW